MRGFQPRSAAGAQEQRFADGARKANAGDMPGACAELSRWTRAGGNELPGLVKRRAAERELCERGLQ
jgi:GH24 family phage-related lysozyme (muramidase)